MMNQSPVSTLEQSPAEPRLIGYARVSTDDQDLSLQIDALTMQGIPKAAIFMDKLSGAKTERPGLTKCLETLCSGDTLVVWRLDRLGRTMRHLITLVEDLRTKGIGFRSINEGAIDTTCVSRELIFNIFSALAQFERRLIQERTKAGLEAARARGRNGGRPTASARTTSRPHPVNAGIHLKATRFPRARSQGLPEVTRRLRPLPPIFWIAWRSNGKRSSTHHQFAGWHR